MMPRLQKHCSLSYFRVLFSSVFLLAALTFSAVAGFSQAGTNNTGNGGRHIIQGRVFIGTGQRVAMQGLKVTVESLGLGDLTAFVDGNGAFVFRNLVPGSYTVLIDGKDVFESVREQVYIDDPGGSSSIAGSPRISGAPQIANIQIFLKPKRIDVLRNEVLNAKWSAIPKEAVQHFKNGLELQQAGKDAEAETEFRNAIGIAPKFAPAYTSIGTLELKAQKLEKAVEAFTSAIRYDPADFDANLNLGIAYYNLRKLDAAEAPLVNAAFIDRFAVTPHYYLGLVFSIKNNVDVAQKAFEKVKELNGGKSLPVIHKYLGRIYMHKQMNKEAVTEFQTYLDLVPGATDADAVRKDIAAIKSRQNTH